MTDEFRRIDDERFVKLDTKIDKVASDVSSIRDMLISEPEQSPMGRALIQRSIDNRALILDLRDDFEHYVKGHQEWSQGFIERRFEPLYDWWNQTKGAWRVITGLAVVLGIVGSFFGILAFFGIRGAP